MPELLEQNAVTVGETRIWSNRQFKDWHRPFLDRIGPEGGCINGRCPHPRHKTDLSTFYDPQAVAFLEQIQPGHKLIFQTRGLAENHAAFFTVDFMRQRNDRGIEIFFQERTDMFPRFYQPADSRVVRQLKIQWSSIRYVAIIDSSNRGATAQAGNSAHSVSDIFVGMLADLKDIKAQDVRRSVLALNDLNNSILLEPRMKLPAGTRIAKLAIEMDNGSPGFISELTKLTETQPVQVAVMIGILTQQGRLSEFLTRANGWQPPVPDRLAIGLRSFIRYYNQNVTPDQQSGDSWMDQWNSAFNLTGTILTTPVKS